MNYAALTLDAPFGSFRIAETDFPRRQFKGPGPEADFVFAAISSYFAKI